MKKADFVYLDSSHDEIETFIEACRMWDVLRVGGIMAGDDYSNFVSVQLDVDKFVKHVKSTLKHSKSVWYTIKTSETLSACWEYV